LIFIGIVIPVFNMAPSAISPPLTPIADESKTKYGDWRDTFFSEGYVVIKNVIPKDRAESYRQQIFEWLKSFEKTLDIENPETWVKENLPIQSKINTFNQYGVTHEKFMWDARTENGVIEQFAKLWGTEELLVSFDALNVTFPNRKDVPKKEAWQHVDQSPFRKGLACAQGIINLSHAGPEEGSIIVYPKSHKLLEEYFETQTDKSTWEVKDGYPFTSEDLKWFEGRGIHPLKVVAESGDLIIWDSRTIHYGAEPTEKSNTIRTVIYACYTPANLASEETLRKKKDAFEKFSATTHWPHDNVVVRNLKAKFDDGTEDPRNRDEPRVKPEYTDKLLKLAGVLPY